jgi:hypothetical protein
MRRLAFLAAFAALALAGCGETNIVVVKRPVIPIYICSVPRERPGEQCAHRFDAARLIGLHLRSAEKLAEAHGYTVRVVAPLPHGAALYQDAESNRLDVETSSFPSANSVVVRIVERG